MLAQYQYELLYRPGPSIANADGLSELRLPDMSKDLKCPPGLVGLLKQLQTAPIDHRQLKKWTVRDPLLSNVSHLVQEQWGVHCPTEELQTYFKRRNKLSVEDRNPALGPSCCFRAFVLPPHGRQTLLEELHESHPGVPRMPQQEFTCGGWESQPLSP